MPPKKRALEETDANVSSETKSKRAKEQKDTSKKGADEKCPDKQCNSEQDVDIDERPPYQYICIDKFHHMGEERECTITFVIRYLSSNFPLSQRKRTRSPTC